ncbi:MAG: NADPH-dependent 7-cyano-7-deazaguanine reductase QueF [Syntrophobacteraceae bacterium]|nr:NADPH-dependent 7-cyano-7-deazaguanine reductase QueF [Syntrophobacteraceae bacterium]
MSDTAQPELTQLGHKAPLPVTPEEAHIETIPNPRREIDYVVRLTSPEFTTLCPITGQPDFAVIIVDYVPRERLVESKSFKLFLGSFRNYGAFNEECTVAIHTRLKEAMDPKYLRVVGLWNPRGGIPIDVAVETGELPPCCRPLPLGNCSYRGGRE